MADTRRSVLPPAGGSKEEDKHRAGRNWPRRNMEVLIDPQQEKERNRLLRKQLTILQGEKDKAREEARMAWTKVDELKKLQEQRGFPLSRGQVSRYEHESLAKRFDKVCAQVRMLQHEKEQGEQRLHQERQDSEQRLLEQLKSLKTSLEESEQDRDSLRYKLSELMREKERLTEQLACAGPSSRREVAKIIEQRDQLQSQLSEAFKGRRGEGEVGSSEHDRLVETSTEVRDKLEVAEGRIRELQGECQRLQQMLAVREGHLSGRGLVERTALSRGSSEEMLAMKRQRSKGRFSQGSMDEEFNLHSDSSDNPSSFSDLAALTRSDSGQIDLHTRSLSFDARKKLSSSTSNLAGDASDHAPAHSRLGELNSRLRTKVKRYERSLEDLRRETSSLTGQMSRLETEKLELEEQLKTVRTELQESQQNLSTVQESFQAAKDKIEALTTSKGVAMRDNAVTYQQSIQRETQLCELQAEKEILVQQRDIANREREKVTSENIAMKRKLEMIRIQRQKDANDLSTMRVLKDKARQEMSELRKGSEELHRSKELLKEELSQIVELVHRAMVRLGMQARGKSKDKSSPILSDLQTMIDHLIAIESERKAIQKKLFGVEGAEGGVRTTADILDKLEGMYDERNSLLMELEALQQSSSKLSEEHIYSLKQRVEELHIEIDKLNAQNKNLTRELSTTNANLMHEEEERSRLSIESERWKLLCEQLKGTQSRLVEEHTKTLERVNELWKQKWPVNWDEAWEEKPLTVPLTAEGYAGFSVVGGRDQPQLPNPGAFIITMVNQGGPAEGLLRVGDILESVNGVSLTNADHREAVRAVKESKGTLNIVVHRRRNAYPIQMGIVSSVNAVPHAVLSGDEKRVEEHEYSLYITGKENLGFRYDWSSVYTVSEVSSSGPANQILKAGDRIVKVNGTSVGHEKPSTVKKMMKPHKNILKMVIERPQKPNCSVTGQALPGDWSQAHDKLSLKPHSWSGSSTPVHSRGSGATPKDCRYGDNRTQESEYDMGPEPECMREDEKAERGAVRSRSRSREHSLYERRNRGSYGSRDSREGFSQGETASQESSSRPVKLVATVTQVKQDQPQRGRPVSDGVVYGNYNERRIEYEEVMQSEASESQYSQTESFNSESCSFDGYGLSSSQSIDLTFHSMSTLTHNRLTVGTMMTATQEPQHSDEDDSYSGFMARKDPARTTVRRSGDNSNSNNSEVLLSDSSQTSFSNGVSSLHHRQKGYRLKRGLFRPKSSSLSSSSSRSLTKLSSSDNNLSRSGSNLASRGKSRSQLSLGRAPSMSVIEEPRRSTSTTNVSQNFKQDPLADANYIRANFTYIQRTPKELNIKPGDVFHILDEAPPERFRASFWVSRLGEEGTDQELGAIPNSLRAQESVEAQGESLEIAVYEEVEAFTGQRPVMMFGALSDQVVSALLESYPNLFYQCPTESVESAARITEARLSREVSEGKLIDFQRVDGGFEVIRVEAVSENKSKHCLLEGTVQALQSLKSVAPPISILIKARTAESITTFSMDKVSQDQTVEMFEEALTLEENHGHEFTETLCLIFIDSLLVQIEKIIKNEKKKQTWVPVARATCAT